MASLVSLDAPLEEAPRVLGASSSGVHLRLAAASADDGARGTDGRSSAPLRSAHSFDESRETRLRERIDTLNERLEQTEGDLEKVRVRSAQHRKRARRFELASLFWKGRATKRPQPAPTRQCAGCECDVDERTPGCRTCYWRHRMRGVNRKAEPAAHSPARAATGSDAKEDTHAQRVSESS